MPNVFVPHIFKIAAGETAVLSNVPPGTTVSVVPGDGGTMNVQYRVTLGGPLQDWVPGSVSAPKFEMTAGPLAQVVFSAVDVDGVAEAMEWR